MSEVVIKSELFGFWDIWIIKKMKYKTQTVLEKDTTEVFPVPRHRYGLIALKCKKLRSEIFK